jgi:hypothetical protein
VTPALPHSWITNTSCIKILYPQNSLLITFVQKQNMLTYLSVKDLSKYFVCCKIVYPLVRLRLKFDGARAENMFLLPAKWTRTFKSAGGVISDDYWQPRCAHQR